MTPLTRTEFLLGKQLPYVAIAFAELPVHGRARAAPVPRCRSRAATERSRSARCCTSAGPPRFGLLISTFVRTQIAAIFASAILTTMPAIQFSGLLVPVSSLSRDGPGDRRRFPEHLFSPRQRGRLHRRASGFAELRADYAALCVLIGVVPGWRARAAAESRRTEHAAAADEHIPARRKGAVQPAPRSRCCCS